MKKLKWGKGRGATVTLQLTAVSSSESSSVWRSDACPAGSLLLGCGDILHLDLILDTEVNVVMLLNIQFISVYPKWQVSMSAVISSYIY